MVVFNNEITRVNDNRVDSLEKEMINNCPIVHCPVKHEFKKGWYKRTIVMPTGALITSQIHLTCHPYSISKGCVAVSIDGDDWDIFEQGHNDFTLPGTRRILYILDECEWSTYHQLDFITGEENDWDSEKQAEIVEKIMNIIMDARENRLLGGVLRQNIVTKTLN